MADLRVYTDDGDRDGGTLGYSGFTGEPKQREWMMTEVAGPIITDANGRQIPYQFRG